MVRESGTFAENKRSRVVAYLTVVGGEVADQVYRVERYVWSDDPDDLGSPMHVSVSARPVQQSREDDAPGARQGSGDPVKQTEVDAKVLAAVEQPEPRRHRRIR